MALTRKQRSALARMPASKRAAAQRAFARQDGRRPGMRARGTDVLAQGVGTSIPRPFGGVTGMNMNGWNAFHPCHTPLPRSVGPYAITRTTDLFQVDNKEMVFCPFQVLQAMTVTNNVATPSPPSWCNIVGAASVDPGNSVNGAQNTQFFHVPMPLVSPGGTLPDDAPIGGQLVPAAFSIQILNAEALQTTSGVVLGTVAHTPVNWGGSPLTWESYRGQVIAYMRPRLMAAGKLALRGVQADSYPLDMSKCAEFTTPFVTSTSQVSTGTWTDNLSPRGWAPILVMNPTGLKLQILVTVEWRTRFSFANPAVASHVQHPVTPDSVWNRMIQTAVAAGNGMKDIVEVVANTGAAIGAAREALGRASGHLPMIVD